MPHNVAVTIDKYSTFSSYYGYSGNISYTNASGVHTVPASSVYVKNGTTTTTKTVYFRQSSAHTTKKWFLVEGQAAKAQAFAFDGMDDVTWDDYD